ncbi:DnaJ-domain-containing protein [Corynespora cassiicola Philippines]|uniref:DnaJ-domain-containing protein n=1 Tax=Corynespora cassiicola Philippines TaxID=1448308 RepID=A0A2T2P546_CORCC|nr:DnaJ-domain-containing protein [Corynespora cassiicola Philippines]
MAGDKEDAQLDSELEAMGKEFDKDQEIDRILSVFRNNAYAVLDLQPGVPENDIKKTYRTKSLLIHPDKTTNPKAPEAFDRLKKAQTVLMDEKLRTELDEYIADARMLVMRERKLTADDEEVKSEDFAKAWLEKTTWVIREEELRKQRRLKAQLREEGRQQRKEEEEMAERKRKREQDSAWENTRDTRINSWRDFQKGKKGAASGAGAAGGGDDAGNKKKKKKIKALG